MLTPGVIPHRRTLYPLFGIKLGAMRVQVGELIAKGWVYPLTSPWASPILFVQKDGGTKLCLCIDYRDVNTLTKKDAFLLPRLDLALQLSSSGEDFLEAGLGLWLLPDTGASRPPGSHGFRPPRARRGELVLGIDGDAVWAGKRAGYVLTGHVVRPAGV